MKQWMLALFLVGLPNKFWAGDCVCFYCPRTLGVTVHFKDGHSLAGYVPWTGNDYYAFSGEGFEGLRPPPRYIMQKYVLIKAPKFYDCDRPDRYPDLGSYWIALENEALAHSYEGFVPKLKQAYDDGSAFFTLYEKMETRETAKPRSMVAAEEDTHKIPKNSVSSLEINPEFPLRVKDSWDFRTFPRATLALMNSAP